MNISFFRIVLWVIWREIHACPVMLRLSLIAALDHQRAIGRDNALPWYLPDDLKRFKALTLGKPVLMGRKTAHSLGRALPGRANLVLTGSGKAPFAGMQAVPSLDAARLRAVELGADEVCVIGGAQVYAQTLAQADALYLTYVDTLVEDADTWFPAFDLADWVEVARSRHACDERHRVGFAFVDYRRVSRRVL